MESKIESLPAEMLALAIAKENLSLTDVSRLMRTNKVMNKRLEFLLYDTEPDRRAAMKFACENGHPRVIRRLVLDYEMSPNFIRLPAHNDGDAITALTLHLAIKKRQLEAFNTLVELGARIDDSQVQFPQLKALHKRLFTTPKPELVRAFFEAGFGNQLPKRLADKSVMMLMRHGNLASSTRLDLLRLLLEQGCDPNHAYALGSARHNDLRTCPLSTAIMQNSGSLFDLLQQEGANIQGSNRFPRRLPLHIPIYAAAYSVSRHGISPMQMCLQNGADINQRAWMCHRDKHGWFHYAGTPLLAYLDSIDSCQWSGVDNHKWSRQPRPYEVIKYMQKKGAVSDDLPEVILPGSGCHHRLHGMSPMYALSPRASSTRHPLSSIEVLLYNMQDLTHLQDNHFRKVVLSLLGSLELEDRPSYKGQILARVIGRFDGGFQRGKEQQVDSWKRFVDLLLRAGNASALRDGAARAGERQSYMKARERSQDVIPINEIARTTAQYLTDRDF